MTEEIRAGSFLGALSASEQAQLRCLGRSLLLQRGDTLFHEGDPSDFVVLILRGNVKVSSAAISGVETLLATRGAGDIVGEMSAVDGEPRSARVSALESVEVRVISARDFTAFLEAHPRVLKILLALVTARLRDADHKRVEIHGLDVLSRIAQRLVELSETHGRPTSEGIALDLSLSQQELAEWVGASREAVAKALRLLRERGAIDTRRRAITILRPEMLLRLLKPPPLEANS